MEACFQISLNEELGPRGYCWLPDYEDEGKAQKLYREHAPWFRELLRVPNSLSLMLPQVLDRIVLFTCRETVALENLMKEQRPVLGLCLHELNRWGMLQGWMHQERSVPFYTLQEGLYYGDPWIYTGHTTYSHSFIWGAGTRSKLEASGNDPSRLLSYGHPDLGIRLQQAGGVLYPDDLPASAKGKDLALLFVSNLEIREAATGLCDGLERTNWHLIVQVHQLASLPYIHKIKQMFAHPSVTVISNATDMHQLWRFMKAAKLYLHIGTSTNVLEWASTGKPSGQIGAVGMHRDFAAEGVSVPVDGLRMIDALHQVDTRWEPDGYPERQAAFVKEELEAVDAAPAIVDRMLGLPVGGQVEKRAA